MSNNFDMMLNLQGSAIVLLLALAVTESEEQASSRHYISKNCCGNYSMCTHPHLRNGSVVTRVSSRGVPVTMVVSPLKSKCCGIRKVQYIMHEDAEHSTVISGLILLAGDVETNPGPGMFQGSMSICTYACCMHAHYFCIIYTECTHVVSTCHTYVHVHIRSK